ncbi:MAG: TetR/AcrR family transcriptional regulator [Acidimicrobiales bacterium]|nr:TetR/AcrR family transcriptional regulator [Acidimicrobiales bacterium]
MGAERGPRRGADPKARALDRRAARGAATRETIEGAAVDLVKDGDLHPSSRRVARRAGVSPRLVFHYFAGIDALLGRAVETHLARQLSALSPPSPRLPLDRRIAATCHDRRSFYEAQASLLLAAGWLAERSAPWGSGRPRPRSSALAGLRDQLAVTFAPEIQRAGIDGRSLLLDLDVLSGWEQWHALRTRLSFSPPEAERWLARQFRRRLVPV